MGKDAKGHELKEMGKMVSPKSMKASRLRVLMGKRMKKG